MTHDELDEYNAKREQYKALITKYEEKFQVEVLAENWQEAAASSHRLSSIRYALRMHEEAAT